VTTATRQKTAKAPKAAASGAFASAGDFYEVIDTALATLDADERSGPLARAAGLRTRFELPDVLAVVNLAVGDAGGRNLRWAHSDEGDWDPKLRFAMDSDVANRFFQGRESLAIAIARGRVRVEGEPRYALLYIPALRLLVEPYRQAVRRHKPGLALD
jgi:hypothetical protein